jgi:hypothetical protein
MNQPKFTLILVTAVTFMVGCLQKPPDIPSDVYPRDSMIIILADVHLAESQISGMTPAKNDPSLREQTLRSSLLVGGLDSTRFRTSFDFYSRHPEFFMKMYEEVINELSRRQAEVVRE